MVGHVHRSDSCCYSSYFERFVDTLRYVMAIILASAVADITRLLSVSTELCHIFIFLLY
jgi:hypothetical protein